MHRSTGSKILIIRRLQSITCSGCMAMQPTTNDGKFAPTDPDRPFSHECSFQDGMRCLDGFNWYAACNIGRSSNPVRHGSPGLARRHPISAVRDEDSKLHRHGFCSARGGRRMRVGAADSALVGTPMRAEGARLPVSCSTRTRSVCARLLRPVLSPARRASARGNASRLRQQAMSRPALKVDRSLVPKWKPPVITAISPWGAGSRPRPGRPTGLARTLVPIRASAPEAAGSSSPCSIPGGSTIHHSRRFHRHRAITTRQRLAGFPCPCRIGMSSSAGRGPPAGQVVTIQPSFPFSHTTPGPRWEAAEADDQQTAR